VAIGRGIQFSARPKAGYYADFGRVLLSGDAAQMGVARIISNCCTAGSPPLDQCPLWVKSGHQIGARWCPLYPRKRTLAGERWMSALCQ